MRPPRLLVPAGMHAEEARAAIAGAGVPGAPVVDAGLRFEGIVTASAVYGERDDTRTIARLTDASAPTVHVTSRLDVALEAITQSPVSWVTVLGEDRRVRGTLSISDLVRAYRRELGASLFRLGAVGAGTRAYELTVTAASPAAGKKLKDAGLPKGALVTSIARADDFILPDGDTVLLPGDRLSLLGGPGVTVLDRLGTVRGS